jgi:DNA polymerase-3 subunit delta
MPTAAAPSNPAPLTLVAGGEDFVVKQRGSRLYEQWCTEIGGLDHEIIDASATNSGEALSAIARLRLALQTLPFFGSGKVVWFKNCNFLGDERTAATQAVTAELTDLARELQAFRWDNVRLLITAGKIDRRKSFYKILEKTGTVELHEPLSIEDKDWVARAEQFVRQELRAHRRNMDDEALAQFITSVGPNLRQLHNELEKLTLYAADRPVIAAADVTAVVSRQKTARAFALGDALGDRDLPRALRCLDEEFWAMKSDRNRSAIGLLAGLISKVRTLLLLKELFRVGLLQPRSDYGRFKVQLESLPTDSLPADKRYNPTAIHPFVLFKAVPQTSHYSLPELVRAMEILLHCNRRLVTSSLEESLVLQQALVQIVGRPTPVARQTPSPR